jgi:hypothetical protein
MLQARWVGVHFVGTSMLLRSSLPERSHTRQRRFPRHSDAARTLFAAAWSLCEAGRWQGKPVPLIGLGIADLGTPEPLQPDLYRWRGRAPRRQ